MVGQGYSCLRLISAHLWGAVTVGWRALDRTVDMHIAPNQILNDNARWGGVFEIVTKPHVRQ